MMKFSLISATAHPSQKIYDPPISQPPSFGAKICPNFSLVLDYIQYNIL